MKTCAASICLRLCARVAMMMAMLAAAGCASFAPEAGTSRARAFTAGNVLFHRDPRWLGADAALSIPLGHDRILWLFGDTFVATSGRHLRSESRMVGNTIAIQSGADPRNASMTFHWRKGLDGSPLSFFPDPDSGPEFSVRKYWPGHGVRLSQGPLVIFLYAIATTPGQGLGFANAGYAIAVVDEPDTSPEFWRPRIFAAFPAAFDAMPATAVVQDGEYVFAVAIRQNGMHAGALVRYRADSLAKGDLGHAEWWAGNARGWVREVAVGADGPVFVIDDAGAECSLHWDARMQSYVHVASYGFGASTIGVRKAPALTGPWSAPVQIYRPPESAGTRPLVYAAKAHPELIALDSADLLVTYAANSFEFADLFTLEGTGSLYWPRFVAIRVGGGL